MKRLILITLVTLTTICLGHHIFAQGVVCVSNLGHAWTQPGIGDIHGLFRGGTPYGTDTAYFTTGTGNFSVDAITLEFTGDSSAPQWVNIQLFQQTGGENVLLGTFGNPVVDPTPTPWPESGNSRDYTTYYDFSSLEPINVNPFSQYSVVLSMPTNSPVDAALLFTISPYTSPVGWTMSPTTSGNPSASGEYLVMSVEATSVPELDSFVILVSGLIILSGCHRRFSMLLG
jgi:hypothetical protein